MSEDPYHSPATPPPPVPVPVHSQSAGGIGQDAGMRLLLPVGRSGWAIAAGYLGLFSVMLLPAPVSLLVSIIAIREIRRSATSQNPKHGMGRAVFGLIMGLLGTGLLVAVLISMM